MATRATGVASPTTRVSTTRRCFWWDPDATGLDEIRKEGTGMYQYVDGGKRYLPGEWPTEDKLFNPDGAVAIYDQPPPGEERGDYPSPAG